MMTSLEPTGTWRPQQFCYTLWREAVGRGAFSQLQSATLPLDATKFTTLMFLMKCLKLRGCLASGWLAGGHRQRGWILPLPCVLPPDVSAVPRSATCRLRHALAHCCALWPQLVIPWSRMLTNPPCQPPQILSTTERHGKVMDRGRPLGLIKRTSIQHC